MLTLDKLPRGEIRAIFSDLDDTLTDHSRVEAETYQALWRLKRSGLWTVIVSGRPAGWADCLMRLWPIDAMIFENGAGMIVRNGEKLQAQGVAQDADPATRQRRLQSIFERLQSKIPTLKLATDQPYRLFDYAIDHSEEPPRLTPGELSLVLEMLAAEKGITAKLSSIHVNYWYGAHTKVTACERLIETRGASLGIGRERILFVGDSPNDEPLFAFFDHTVGVANIRKYLPSLKSPPRYLADRPAGEGFRQIVSHLLPRDSRTEAHPR